MNNHFICFEGIDGSGKTTIAHEFVNYGIAHGHRMFFLDKKNTDAIEDDFAKHQLEHIKRALWNYPIDGNLSVMGDYHWLTLLASWYAALYEACVKPKIQEGYTVVSDGWVYKYMARFSMKKSFPSDLVDSIFNMVGQPDSIFLIDVSPQVAFSRKFEVKPSESGQFDGESESSLEQGFINYQMKVINKLEAVLCNRFVRLNNNIDHKINTLVEDSFSYYLNDKI